jgi:hypothetical protein
MATEKMSRSESLGRERDLRRAPRRSTRDLAIIALGREPETLAGDSFPVQMHDLSMRGARFSGQIPLNRGDHFVLYLPTGDKRVALLATAVHVSRNNSGQTTVGAEFTGILNRTSDEKVAPAIQEAEMSRIRATMLGA